MASHDKKIYDDRLTACPKCGKEPFHSFTTYGMIAGTGYNGVWCTCGFNIKERSQLKTIEAWNDYTC